MTIETMLTKIIEGAPNLIIAVFVLYRQQNVIEQLLAHQRTLIDKLLSMVDVKEAQAIRAELRKESSPPGAATVITTALMMLLSAVIL